MKSGHENLDKRFRCIDTDFEGVCTAVGIYRDSNDSLLLKGQDATGRPVEYWANSEAVEEPVRAK